AFRQLADLSRRGWYEDKSHKFASSPSRKTCGGRQRRIWLYMPYYGQLPNYFQLYLDSLERNKDCLSVLFITDNDLANYHVPENLFRIEMSLDELRRRCASLLADEFGVAVEPQMLIKGPYKLCDFRVIYPKLFDDIGTRYGVTEEVFVG